MFRLTLSKALAAVCVACAFALCLARPATADVTSISELQPSSTGTYFYPQDELTHQFTPGYFYVASDGPVTFTISAPDGATLHIFDDAAGTNELTVPSYLQQAGQARTIDQIYFPQKADVFLTQGWHKCYLELNLLSVRTGDEACLSTCRLNYSNGILYDKVQSVSATYAFDPWQEGVDGSYTCTGTVTFSLPDGTPAASDTTTCQIAKITSDLQGQQLFADVLAGEPERAQDGEATTNPSPQTFPQSTPQSASTRVAMTSNSTTDSEGKIHVTLRWNGTPLDDQTVYVWMQFADSSRPNLATGGTGVTFQAPPMLTAFGGKPVPSRIVQEKLVGSSYINNSSLVGHAATYLLKVIDQNRNRWTGGFLSETLVNDTFAPYCPFDLRGLRSDPAKDIPLNNGGQVIDKNYGFSRQTWTPAPYGYFTLWYSLDQLWTLAYPLKSGPTKVQLNPHHLTHYQGYVERTY